jgi:hypothetical protein
MQIKTGFAPINGAQIHYEVAGTGRPLILILLHAEVADGRMWDDQFAILPSSVAPFA